MTCELRDSSEVAVEQVVRGRHGTEETDNTASRREEAIRRIGESSIGGSNQLHVAVIGFGSGTSKQFRLLLWPRQVIKEVKSAQC